MRLLLLLIFALMGLAGAQGPASPLRLVTSEGVVTAFRGAAALRTPAGRLIWRRDLPVRWIEDVQVTGESLLLAVAAQDGSGVLILNLRTGLLTSADLLAGANLNVDAAGRRLRRGWGVEGERVWWVSTSSGAYISSRTRVVDLTWGLTQEISGVPFARQGPVLFFSPSTQISPLSQPERLALIFWDTRAGLAQSRTFTVAARPGCGALLGASTLDDYANDLDGPTFTALRRDGCGLFRSRFLWAQSKRQTPGILPAP